MYITVQHNRFKGVSGGAQAAWVLSDILTHNTTHISQQFGSDYDLKYRTRLLQFGSDLSSRVRVIIRVRLENMGPGIPENDKHPKHFRYFFLWKIYLFPYFEDVLYLPSPPPPPILTVKTIESDLPRNRTRLSFPLTIPLTGSDIQKSGPI